MMASLKFALFLSICLFGYALISADEVDVLEKDTQNGDVCLNCTEVFELLAEVLSSTDLQEMILDEAQCNNVTIAPTLSKFCKKEVKEMLPLALNLIFASMELRNSTTGRRIKLFSRHPVGGTTVIAGQSEIDELPIFGRRKGGSCFVCKFILTTVVNLLPAERTEQSISEVLAKVCHILPKYFEDKCSELIQTFGPEIMDLLLSHTAPTLICKAIRLC